MSVISCSGCNRYVDTDFDVEVLFCNDCSRVLCSQCCEDEELETDNKLCDLCEKSKTAAMREAHDEYLKEIRNSSKEQGKKGEANDV